MDIDFVGIATLITSLTASVVSIYAMFNIKKIEVATNSMKDALVESTKQESLLKGADIERQAEADRKVGLAAAVVDAVVVTTTTKPKKKK